MLTAILRRHSIHILLATVAGLVALGIVMLFSTSAFALESHGDMYYFLKRQSMWLGIGIVILIVTSVTDYHVWQRTWWVWFAIAAVLLALCYIPPIGMRINGSNRWINLGFMTFQPSELGKIAALFFLAWWFSKFESKSKGLLFGFIMPSAVVGILLALIVFEVDFGTTALIGATMFGMMFVAGTSMLWLAPLVLVGLAGVVYAATHVEERAGRLLAFLDPEKYKLGEGWQQLQALIAIGSGGVNGLGLGEGRQKMLYLPYAHTDFIFPMIGEELGLRFTVLVVLGFLIFAICGYLVAMNAKDRFGMLLGFGMTTIIALQAAINIGVTTSMLPNKGMPLPFISSGGSNLALCLLMIGILVNIHRHGHPVTAPAAAVSARRVQLAARVTRRI
jgi:cell division protein FtsW